MIPKSLVVLNVFGSRWLLKYVMEPWLVWLRGLSDDGLQIER